MAKHEKEFDEAWDVELSRKFGSPSFYAEEGVSISEEAAKYMDEWSKRWKAEHAQKAK